MLVFAFELKRLCRGIVNWQTHWNWRKGKIIISWLVWTASQKYQTFTQISAAFGERTHTPKCQPERKNCLKLYIVIRSKFAMPSNDFHLNNLNKLFPTKYSRILEASFEPQINGNVHSSDRNHFYCDLWTCLAVTSEGDFHYLWALNVYRDWKTWPKMIDWILFWCAHSRKTVRAKGVSPEWRTIQNWILCNSLFSVLRERKDYAALDGTIQLLFSLYNFPIKAKSFIDTSIAYLLSYWL